jgi:PAS domain S-box-containing protein
MQNIKYFYLLFIFLILSPDLIYAQETIKSAAEYDYPPFSIVNEKGEADGFSVELLRASLKAAGLDVKFSVGPWAKIKQDLAKGKIQVLPLVGRTPEREKIYDFSVPYLTNYGGIFVRKDQTNIKTLKDLADKEILVMKGDNAEEFLLRENVSKHIIPTESFEDAFKMLSQGKHDAVVAQQIVGRQLIKKLGITNVINISRIDTYKQDWTFAVKQGDKELLASLNDGLSKIIIDGTFDKIHDKWFGKIKAEKKLKSELTAKEREFLKSHPIITLGTDESWAPYVYKDRNGVLSGLDIDFINLINHHTGANIQVRTGKWADIVEQAKNHNIDGLLASGRLKEREPFFNFSDVYVSEFMLIIASSNSAVKINNVGDLAGKTIAIQKGNKVYSSFLQSVENVKIIEAESESESVKLLLEGKSDFCILGTSTVLVHQSNYSNSIKISYVVTEKPSDLVYSIRKDWPQLVSIINKGLDSIPEETRNIFYKKWFGITQIDKETLPEKKEQFSYAKKAIKQKAEDVARQVEIYLNAYPDKTLKDLQNDPEFQKIAIQPVGKTGYTAISDYKNLVILFHPNKDLIGVELESLSKNYPVMWELVKQAQGGNDVSGVYEFPDLNGVVKNKYMYIKIPNVKTADGVGMWVGAVTYLDEYETIEPQKEKKESLPIIPLAWVLGILILILLLLLILNKLNIVKFEKNAIMLVLAIALLLIIGLFIFNAYNISNNLKKTAIENYFDTLKATAFAKYVNIEQHITHMKSSFKVLSSRKTISNEDLMKIVKLGEDFYEIFIIGSNGKITHASDISHIGLPRLTDPYFKNSKQGIYIKPLYLSETVGEILFSISIPYNKGILVARLNLNHIYEIISKNKGLGKSGESLLAYRNKNGDAVFFTERRFTAESEARDIIPKEDIHIPITQALLKNEKEFSDYVDYRGVPVFAVTMYIDKIDAGLVVKIDRKEALESVSTNINQIWYSTSVIILAIIIIGIIFYFMLTNTLRGEVKSKTNELEKASMGLREKVSQLQNSERELIESEEKVRNIFENSTIVHYSYGVNQVVTYISPQIENILGYAPEEAMVKWADLASDNPVNEIAFENTMKAIKTGERQPAYEFEFVHKNGKKVYVEISEAPVVKNGKTISIVGSFTDITGSKKAEQEKIKLETQLRQAQKMESIGTLTGGIAHDFNNIMAIILGNTELALDDVPKWNSAHSSLEEIKKASLRAKNIVKQLLSFSRKTDQKLQPIQITLVIKDALKFLRSTIPTTINIHRDIPATKETILADPTQINQIIMNLCINASQAMEQTGGDLTIAVEKVVLDDNSARDFPGLKSGNHVKIMISDTGPGIDPEIIDQIFDPYFTTKEIGKGSGMGLAVVHGIVKSHGGAIAVGSNQGKGTEFIILFPLITEKPITENQTIQDIPKGNETILFVDDEISIIKMVQRMFEHLGYKVETATMPQEALDRFSLNPDHFDLVITDMTMPQMTGVQLSEKLMDIRPDIPIIICTGYSELVDEEKAKELGLAAYVMKPIDMQETAQAIRKILDKKEYDL